MIKIIYIIIVVPLENILEAVRIFGVDLVASNFFSTFIKTTEKLFYVVHNPMIIESNIFAVISQITMHQNDREISDSSKLT